MFMMPRVLSLPGVKKWVVDSILGPIPEVPGLAPRLGAAISSYSPNLECRSKRDSSIVYFADSMATSLTTQNACLWFTDATCIK